MGTIYPWHNGFEPLNVSAEGGITPLDALLVINVLNSEHKTDLPTDRPRPLAAPFLDVSRDGQLTPFDALLVINFLNKGEGEGEHSADSAVPATTWWQSADTTAQEPVGAELERRETVA